MVISAGGKYVRADKCSVPWYEQSAITADDGRTQGPADTCGFPADLLRNNLIACVSPAARFCFGRSSMLIYQYPS